jgi:hypothetical protein
MTVDEWVTYARRFGADMVLETAKQEGLSAEDLDQLAHELRKLDPQYRSPRRHKPGPRPRPTIHAERQAGTACAHCGRPLAGRADRRTCSVACRVALKRTRDGA